MQVSQLLANGQGEIIVSLSGDFVKIEKVPSGNTLTIRTNFAGPLPNGQENSGIPNTENENESFIGPQGRSIKFENPFQQLYITGAAQDEEITIQTGFGWMLDSEDTSQSTPLPVAEKVSIAQFDQATINNEGDFKFLILTITGFNNNELDISTYDQNSRRMGSQVGNVPPSIPIFYPDGSLAASTNQNFNTPASGTGLTQYTVVIPLMGASFVNIYNESGPTVTFSGQLTNSWGIGG